jgi:hypothetical protein
MSLETAPVHFCHIVKLVKPNEMLHTITKTSKKLTRHETRPSQHTIVQQTTLTHLQLRLHSKTLLYSLNSSFRNILILTR